MIIQEMFEKGIDRPINGVVKVNQDESDVLVQELDEYVITRELKKHFITFFNNYLDAFRSSTADIGVWISGFFGSGKSHFLKMLSYLLENKEVQGVKTIERFREKFADDPATFMLIDQATRGETHTILFNIDIEGSINKDKTAVLRVFAKMFYSYLGYYGENLKVAKLEQFIDRKGKTEAFRRVFEEKNGTPWLESRDVYAFLEDDIVATLQEVLGMSETAATNWFNGEEAIETSIAQLVSEIKEYVESKPDDFRLLFMIDEVGQYVGGDTDLLINLQSLVEDIGSKCGGKVWVVCTGQEAVDEIIKTRENEFSRIHARFKTRLSLSSSSADEVIQKRILLKKAEAVPVLEDVYSKNDAGLRNLFSFTDSVMDIKGYSGPVEFTINYPFVPYQFILMQKVFAEIRKHGNSGKHLSGGERSMLSGFQEAAQKIEFKDEYALAPFYLFYDTVHTFLDSSIRRVIERCQRASETDSGIKPQDVNVLKLLYLIRYVDDVKANLDNIVILMADDIRLDKITMREQVRGSLDRLHRENYIGRSGDTYNFLTDEEQDIQREIKNTIVPNSDIVRTIAQNMFTDIYTAKKYRYGQRYDFPFDQMVDGIPNSVLTGGMMLRILTAAADPTEKDEFHVLPESKGQAIIILGESRYYDSLETALKIRKYIKQKNIAQMPKSVQDILRDYQDEATKLEKAAVDELKAAIETGKYYVDGERIDIKGGDSKSIIDQALEYLVSHVYSELGLIARFTETDEEIVRILRGEENDMSGMVRNRDAAAKVEEFLEVRRNTNVITNMDELQRRYQQKPYGWREIDIAAVVAVLISQQKVTIKYGGNTIQPDNPRLVDMLRKKTEIGKTVISIRQRPNYQDVRRVREFLRDFFDEMDVPEDEDNLIRHIKEQFEGELKHYTELLSRYKDHKYPDVGKVSQAIELVKDVLSQQNDNIALIRRVVDREDDLYDMKDNLQLVEEFFKSRVSLFDTAVSFVQGKRNDLEYIGKDEEANAALNRIRLITLVQQGTTFDYSRLPELNDLMAKVKASHDGMLEEKRAELLEIVRQCLQDIRVAAGEHVEAKPLTAKADAFYSQKKVQIASIGELALLDGLVPGMWSYKDSAVEKIEVAITPPVKIDTPPKDQPVKPKKVVKNIHRQAMFPAKTLMSDEEIDAYVESVRANMKRMLKGADGIRLN